MPKRSQIADEIMNEYNMRKFYEMKKRQKKSKKKKEVSNEIQNK